MEHRLTDRVLLLIAAFGALATVVCLSVWGVHVGLGAAVGSLVSAGNWLVLRRVMRGLVRGGDRSRAGWTSVLVAKMIALMAGCWLILAVAEVDPVGFSIGLGALVLGALFGSSSVAGMVDAAEAERERHAAR